MSHSPNRAPQTSSSNDNLQEVVAAVIERRGRWLLAQRPGHKMHGGLWEFPGGKVDPGESHALALERELFEELALQGVSVGEVLGVQSNAQVRLHFLAVSTTSAPIALEHSALGWFKPEEALVLPLAPLDRAYVTRLR